MSEKIGDPVLAKRIKDLRGKLNLTQEELANKIGLSVSYLQKLETAKLYGGKETHQKLADALEVSVSFLLFGKDEKPKSRIPDMPDNDPPLEPELLAVLNDPRIGGIFFSKQYLSRLSNRQLRQIALDALSLINENDDNEK